MAAPDFIFGYGSLVAARDVVPAALTGFRRAWAVGMDNRSDVPGYKRYLTEAGERPPYVCFLDLRAAPGGVVDGVIFEVDDARLAQLDARERNYRRVEITDRLADPPPGRIWAYVGLDEARARAHEPGAVIAADYAAEVEAAFAAIGALDAFRASTDPPTVPVVALRRESVE